MIKKEDLKIYIVRSAGFNILVELGDKKKLIHVSGCGFDKLIENLGEYVGIAIKEFNQ